MENNLYTAISTADEPDTAVDELLETLDEADSNVQLVTVYCTPEYATSPFIAALNRAFDSAPLIGATTDGQFIDGDAADSGVAVSLLTGDIDVETARAAGLSESGIEAGVEAAADSLSEDIFNHEYNAGINLHDGLMGRGEEIALLGYQQFGVPFTGGSAGDALNMEETLVFHNDEIVTNGIVFAIFGGDKPFGQGVSHGHHPVSEPLTVTKADENIVHELNGRSAFDVFAEQIKEEANEIHGVDLESVSPDEKEFTQLLTAFEVGIATTNDQYKVRWPGPTADKEGPLAFATKIPEGVEITIMHSDPDAQISAARESAATSVDGADNIAGAYVFDCTCQGIILGDRFAESVNAMHEELDAPLVGMKTYGEICLSEDDMRGYHNTTSSTLTIPK